MERRPSFVRRLRRETLAQERIGFGQLRKTLLECAEIKPGAAHQQWHASLRRDLLHGGHRIATKIRRRVRLGGIADVDQSMRVARQGRRVRLGCANIETAIDQG